MKTPGISKSSNGDTWYFLKTQMETPSIFSKTLMGTPGTSEENEYGVNHKCHTIKGGSKIYGSSTYKKYRKV